MFIDQAHIVVRSGRGGNGIISFRREKYIPKGGPDGGNGGRGGDIILRVDRQLTTLMDFRYKRKYIAQDGEAGARALCSGKAGQDIVLRIPPGTLVKDSDSGEVIVDLINPGEEFVIAKGGKGGRGNNEFKSATVQAPRKAEPGTPGEEKNLLLELKLLADVGLVGFPNAGKSTLISRISAAKPKIADYPFTTLIPNLGIVAPGEYSSFVVADMPGLIEGASDGKGLGIQFLRHIERTRVLVFLLPCDSADQKADYKTLLNELTLYDKDLPKRPQIIAISKMDIADDEILGRLKKLIFKKDIPVFRISAVSGEGLDDLVAEMWNILEETRKHEESN